MIQLPADIHEKLRAIAHENAMAYKLLCLWENSAISYEEWSAKAIIVLLEQNDILFKAAVDAEKRAYPRPIIYEGNL